MGEKEGGEGGRERERGKERERGGGGGREGGREGVVGRKRSGELLSSFDNLNYVQLYTFVYE